MNGEVISIHIGQAGIQMGNAVWELLKVEHEMDRTGNLLCFCPWPLKDNTNSLFYETNSGRYCPRAVFVDSEPNVINEILYDHCEHNIPPYLLVAGNEDGSGNFGRGYNLVANELLDKIMERISSLNKNADHLCGYILYHSLSGGTGSGLTCRIVEKLKENHPKTPIIHLCIFPSPTLNTNIIEIYNAMLANAAYGDEADMMICVDNESLYKICQHQLQISKPSYVNINRRISQIASSLTTSYRFYGCLSATFSIFQTNLIPYPDIHYPFVAYSSYGCVDSPTNLKDITWQTFSSYSQTLSVNPMNGSYISCCLLYRGRYCSPSTINAALREIKTDKNIHFMDWVPNSFKIAINSQMPGYVPQTDFCVTDKALCNLSNHTGITKIWEVMSDRFTKSFKRKAYLHWFQAAGVEEKLFDESLHKMLDVIKRHKALEGAVSNVSHQNTSPKPQDQTNQSPVQRSPDKSAPKSQPQSSRSPQSAQVSPKSQTPLSNSPKSARANAMKNLLNSNSEVLVTNFQLEKSTNNNRFSKYSTRFQEMLKKSFENLLNINKSKSKQFEDNNLKKEFLSKFVRDSTIDESLMKYSKIYMTNESNKFYPYTKFLVSQQLPIRTEFSNLAICEKLVRQNSYLHKSNRCILPMGDDDQPMSNADVIEHTTQKIEKTKKYAQKPLRTSKKQNHKIALEMECKKDASDGSTSHLNLMDLYIDVLTDIYQ